jgi:hypothetical protein
MHDQIVGFLCTSSHWGGEKQPYGKASFIALDGVCSSTNTGVGHFGNENLIMIQGRLNKLDRRQILSQCLVKPDVVRFENVVALGSCLVVRHEHRH